MSFPNQAICSYHSMPVYGSTGPFCQSLSPQDRHYSNGLTPNLSEEQPKELVIKTGRSANLARYILKHQPTLNVQSLISSVRECWLLFIGKGVYGSGQYFYGASFVTSIEA
ncbi:MAG: hypothetical protein IPO98_08115 [Saprospiraceae bacterium]|nr:hypothetical protein [Saprospiraceae bacterium]